MTDLGSFWARRRAAVKAEEDAETALIEKAEVASSLEGKDDDEILAELGLPDPAKMQPGDDFSQFMSGQVPDHLRRVALRTLWRSNPVLACVDGLNEYDDDYRAAMLLSEPVKTAYQVGKGMKAHLDEMERQAEEKALAENTVCEDPDEDNPVKDEATEARSPQPELAPEPVKADVCEGFSDDTSDEPADVLVPRRMRFQFEEVVA